jgi:DNA gyrase subunit B
MKSRKSKMAEKNTRVEEKEKPAAADSRKTQGTYTADDIKVLDGLDGVRRRPAMYIGDTSAGGLHHLIFEVVDNSVDEALAGHCKRINISLNSDGSVSVMDDGRGIPVDIHAQTKLSALEVVMTKLHAGGKFDHKVYKVSGGLHGVGVSVVNALSEWMEVEVFQDGTVWFQEYERGKPKEKVRKRGKTKRRGTKVVFKPDPDIFGDSEINFETVSKRMRELAFLNAGIEIILSEESSSREEKFCYKDGIQAFIKYLNQNKKPLHRDVVHISGEEGDISVELGLQYNDGYSETLLSFVNTINTIEGGTHVSGLRSALTRTLNRYVRKEKLSKEDKTPSGDDFREGLVAVLSVNVPEPQFESQTKIKLGNREIQGIVESLINDKLSSYLEENPSTARAIARKAVTAMRAREAARKAKELVQRRDALVSSNLPGKLADCSSKDVESTELYLVEGDSAGGTAKMGRDRRFQAILPLGGKILNVEKARIDKVLAHDEIRTIVQALGTGIGQEDFDISKLRYGKVILMTDADVDGSHIRTLLLTFFFRQMKDLVDKGRIYIAQPPLYRVRHKGGERYVQTDKEMKKHLLELGANQAILSVKGKRTRLDGARLRKFLETLASIEGETRGLARKGVSIAQYVGLRDEKNGFPKYKVTIEGDAKYLFSDKEFEQFKKRKEREKGSEVDVAEDDDVEQEDADMVILEFRERDTLERLFAELSKMGFEPQSYPEPEDPLAPAIISLASNGDTTDLTHLQGVLETVRKLGSKGLDIQRYKGLGEMNPKQLWETTMDPARRQLLQVTGTQSAEADRIFNVLMGPNVEPRRDFIERFALDVRNLDI